MSSDKTHKKSDFSTNSRSSLFLENITDIVKNHRYYHHHVQEQHHPQQCQHQHLHQSKYHHNQSNHLSSRSLITPIMKRGKKNWGSRERSGMSFLIVIAFFAVFGLIILTEVFMIDEKSHSGILNLRQGNNLGVRFGDSIPDYDNVKDDYDQVDGSIITDSKLGFVQLRDNKLKIQVAGDGTHHAGVLLGSGGAIGVHGHGESGTGNVPMAWGQSLPIKIEQALPHFPIDMLPTDGSWQVVNGTRFKFFVFSAYYDRRDGVRLVRVIGATKTRGPERVWCRFWYNKRNVSQMNEASMQSYVGKKWSKYKSVTVMARVKIIRENWNLKYSACFVLCPLSTVFPQVPKYVSIVSRLRAPPGNILIIRNTDWDPDFAAYQNANNSTSATSFSNVPPTGEQIPDKLAVCVKPFHFNYDQSLYIMEYLELYSLLGVSHFTFFNHTMGPHASCVLKAYADGIVPNNITAYDISELNVVTSEVYATDSIPLKKLLNIRSNERPTIKIMPWNLRMRSQKEIRTEGLFAALNDCLYRSMHRFKYLALVDLDEFIMPHYADNLNELLRSLNHRFRNRNTGSYSFQNAFFYLQFPDDPLSNSMGGMSGNEDLARVRAALITQKKTRRRYKLHPQKQRSKYICKPEAVIEAGNHFVWEYVPGQGSLNVPPKEAILQHYRVCEFGGNDCVKAPSVVDRTATKYVKRLVQRIDIAYKYLRQRCNLPSLPELSKQPTDIKPLVTKNVNSQVYKNVDMSTLLTKRKIKMQYIYNNLTKKDTKIKASTMTMKTTTLMPTTPEEEITIARKKRKLIVFEINEYGAPYARIEYQ